MAAATLGQVDSGLLTAAFSAIMGIPLSTDAAGSGPVEKVSVFDHHKTTYSYGRVGDSPSTSADDDRCLLLIKTLNNGSFECDVKKNAKIEEIKARIHELSAIPSDQQRLIYSGKQLEDGRTMSEYHISADSVLHLVARLNTTRPVTLDPSSLDPVHNYDFTDINDGDQTFMRGGQRYVRPCGFKRFALNISDKYENWLWIGCSNGTDEWPVSYHGTGEHQKNTIAEDGYARTRGQRYPFTRGVYSTPDVHVAEKYAKKFTYDNEQYLVIFQNRVNPKTLQKLPSTETGTGDYWVSPSEADVRPYGICIRKVSK